MASPSEKELSAELEVARQQMTASVGGIQRSLDVKARFQRSYAQNQTKYIIGLFVTGIAAAYFMTRNRTRVEYIHRKEPVAAKAGKSALLLSAAGFLFQLARPAIIDYAKRYLMERGRHAVSGSRFGGGGPTTRRRA